MCAQAGADALQIAAEGFTLDGSSSVPARTMRSCGRSSAALNT